MWAAGIITTGNILGNDAIIAIANRPAAYADINPIITAFGAYGNTVGTSSAGREPGIYFSEMITNAAVISAKNIRTPDINIDIPATNVNASISGKTNQCVEPAISWVNAWPAFNVAI